MTLDGAVQQLYQWAPDLSTYHRDEEDSDIPVLVEEEPLVTARVYKPATYAKRHTDLKRSARTNQLGVDDSGKYTSEWCEENGLKAIGANNYTLRGNTEISVEVLYEGMHTS